MQYMMFVATDAAPDDTPEAPDELQAWLDHAAARRLMGDRLRPTGEGKTVRVRRGERIVTDGPFAESKEVIVGFDILECDSLEEAVEIASRHPMARAGRIEVRAFWPFED